MKKILYIINVDWFFIYHFLPVGLEGIKRGQKLHIACGVTDKKEYLESLGFVVHPLSLSRSGTSIKSELKTFIEMYKVIKAMNTPSISGEVFCVGTSKKVSINNLVSVLNHKYSKNIEANYLQARNGDIKESICDNRKMQKYLEINEFIEFYQGIRKL